MVAKPSSATAAPEPELVLGDTRFERGNTVRIPILASTEDQRTRIRAAMIGAFSNKAPIQASVSLERSGSRSEPEFSIVCRCDIVKLDKRKSLGVAASRMRRVAMGTCPTPRRSRNRRSKTTPSPDRRRRHGLRPQAAFAR
jgi:hypothetical protein